MDSGNGRMMTTTQVAKLLGVRAARVADWCAKGTLPGIRIGRCWRLDREAIERWLENRQDTKRPEMPRQPTLAEVLAAPPATMSTREAAERLGVSRRTVQQYAAQLEGTMIGGSWRIPTESVTRAQREGLPMPKAAHRRAMRIELDRGVRMLSSTEQAPGRAPQGRQGEASATIGGLAHEAETRRELAPMSMPVQEERQRSKSRASWAEREVGRGWGFSHLMIRGEGLCDQDGRLTATQIEAQGLVVLGQMIADVYGQHARRGIWDMGRVSYGDISEDTRAAPEKANSRDRRAMMDVMSVRIRRTPGDHGTVWAVMGHEVKEGLIRVTGPYEPAIQDWATRELMGYYEQACQNLGLGSDAVNIWINLGRIWLPMPADRPPLWGRR